MISSTASSPLKSADCTPVSSAVVPEAAVAHDGQRAPLHHRRYAGAAREAHAVAEDRVAETRTARTWRRRGSRCRPAMCTGPTSCCASFMRREHRALRAADAELRRPRRQRPAQCLRHRGTPRGIALEPRPARSARSTSPACRPRNAESPCASTSTVYSPAIGSMSLPWTGVCTPARRKVRGDLLLDEFGLALLDHQHRALARAEARICPGTSG